MNVYYDPEKFGLEIIAEIEYSDGCCQFDTRVVWQRKEDGKLFTARDSGCSCPTPFEDYHLGNIDALDFDALRAEVKGELSNRYAEIKPDTAQDFLRTVELARK